MTRNPCADHGGTTFALIDVEVVMLVRSFLFASIIGLASCVSSCQRGGEGQPTTLTSASLPKRTLLAEHAAIELRIEEASDAVIALSNERDDATLKARVVRLTSFLTLHLNDHIRWEETVVYEVVDQRARGANAFTTTLRAEHRLIERRIGDLREAADVQYIDNRELVGRCHELVGLIRAHLEIEDRVLLPILDQTMAWEELDRALQIRAVPHDPPR